MDLNVRFEKKGSIKRVSFFITPTLLAKVIYIVVSLISLVLMIKVFWPFVFLIVFSIHSLLPVKKVIEINEPLNKLKIKGYIFGLAWLPLRYSSYYLDLFKKSPTKYGWSPPGNIELNYFLSNPRFDNFPTKKQAAKIDKFLGIPAGYGVAYL